MSDETKDPIEETTSEANESPEGAEIEAQGESEGEIEIEAEGEDETGAEVEVPAEREASEPGGTALATRGETSPVSNERIWAALSHASILLTFILGVSTGGLAVVVAAMVPPLIWLAFRHKSRFIAFHAMQATAFQLGSLLAWIGLLVVGLAILVPTWIVTILLMIILVGFLLLPLTLVLTLALPVALTALPLAALVYGLYGAFEVYAGREFRYWRVADWIERQGVTLQGEPANRQPGAA